MNPTVDRLFSEAMAMPSELRALLASQLLETLDDHTENANNGIKDDVSRLNLTEVKKRLKEIKSGRVEAISSHVAAERIRRVLGE